MSTQLISAACVCPEPGKLVFDGGLELQGGRIIRVLKTHAEVQRSASRTGQKPVRLEGWLTPGFVNAHAHLELTDCSGHLPQGADFPTWVKSLMGLRASQDPATWPGAVVRGAHELLRSGTTCVGDVLSTQAGWQARKEHRLRVVHYRELLDAGDPTRTEQIIEECKASVALDSIDEENAATLSELHRHGLSPHAPFTVSDALMRFAALGAKSQSLPISVHWSESEEEMQYLEKGSGPWSKVLPASQCKPGLERLVEAGLLGARTALIHGNFAKPTELSQIANAGASLVHCPGSHSFFQRDTFPLIEVRRAGVNLALGTDSKASNAELSMQREMRLFREAYPEEDPVDVWAAGTRCGAQALGFANGQRVREDQREARLPTREPALGVLIPGAWADLVEHLPAGQDSSPKLSPRSVFEALTFAATRVAKVWVAGRAQSL